MAIRTHDVQFTDKNTGEILEGTPMLIPFKKKLKEPWLIMKLEGLRSLAFETDLGQQEFRVLMFYLSAVDFENHIPITQTQIANELGMHKVVVSKVVKKLVAKQILHEGEKSGRSKTYSLNTAYGWRGKINDKYFALCQDNAEYAYSHSDEGRARDAELANHKVKQLKKDPKYVPDIEALSEASEEPLPIIEYLDAMSR